MTSFPCVLIVGAFLLTLSLGFRRSSRLRFVRLYCRSFGSPSFFLYNKWLLVFRKSCRATSRLEYKLNERNGIRCGDLTR